MLPSELHMDEAGLACEHIVDLVQLRLHFLELGQRVRRTHLVFQVLRRNGRISDRNVGWVRCKEQLDAKEEPIVGKVIELGGLIFWIENVGKKLRVLVEFPDFHLRLKLESVAQLHTLIRVPNQKCLCHK